MGMKTFWSFFMPIPFGENQEERFGL